MKPLLAAIVVTLTGLGMGVSQGAVLAEWTFETSVPTTAGPHVAEGGIYAASSSAIGFHSSAATVWSNPVGNGSLESFSANNWSAGDYFQFQTSTLGYLGISVSWEQTRSSTGPGNFRLAWSLDGTSFTDALNYTVNAVTWSSSSYSSGSAFSANLSTVADLDNKSTIYFRIISDEAGSAAAGSGRVDDFRITAIPEPAEWGLICALGLLGVCGLHTWRERRRARRQLPVVS